MAAKFFLVSTKAPGLEFKILNLDKEKMRARLQGDTGVPFERSISQSDLDTYGYKIEKREVRDLPPVPETNHALAGEQDEDE